MNYIDDNKLTKTKDLGKTTAVKAMDTLGTPTIIWQLLKRHKTGLWAGLAIIFMSLYIFPPLPHMVLSVLGVL